MKVTIDGLTFDSKREAARYGELKLLEKAGEICAVTCQMRYPLIVGEQLIASYVADFVYHTSHGAIVVEDVKGVKTPVYRLKKKLMAAIYGIQIKEIGVIR